MWRNRLRNDFYPVYFLDLFFMLFFVSDCPAPIKWTDIKTSVVYDIISNPPVYLFGGEAQIYHAKAENSEIEYAAKVYVHLKINHLGEISDPLYEVNRKHVVEFLQNVDGKKHHILSLISTGVIEDSNSVSHLIDIFPYCSGGDIKTQLKNGRKFSYKELRESVIPNLVTALSVMHKSELTHRDLKPANIYELDNDIVLADFGATVKVIDGSGRTSKAIGTPGYKAPEINLRSFNNLSDYFSLGCTLATLYLGKHPYEHLLTNINEDVDFYAEIMKNNGLEMLYQEGDEPLKWLIDSLCRYYPKDRPDYDGVQLWLNDCETFRRKYVDSYKSSYEGTWSKPYNFEHVEYWNEIKLAETMQNNWKGAERHLYQGLIAEFSEFDQSLRAEATKIVEEVPTAQNRNLGVARFLHFLSRGGNLCWNGKAYKSLSDISASIYEDEKNEVADESFYDDVIMMLQSEYLSWKFNAMLQLPNVSGVNAEKYKNGLPEIIAIERIVKKHPIFAYYYAMNKWSNDPELVIDESIDDFLVQALNWSVDKFYKGISADNDWMWAYIAAMGHRSELEKLIDGFVKGDDIKNYVSVYAMFEALCDKKATVRSHFYHYGPYAYLAWLRDNLNDLYSFNTKEAEQLRSDIEDIHLSEEMSLSEQNECLKKLNVLIAGKDSSFHKLFQGDFIISCLGLTKKFDEPDGITATNIDAFFIDKFPILGTPVPQGFKKCLKLSGKCL